MSAIPRNTILTGDSRTVLPTIPDNSIDCIITSPPYFQLRNYQAAEQIGLERTVDEWVAALLDVLDDSGRVLKPTGSLWLNLGDAYSRHPKNGAAAKSLLLGPERVAVEMQRRGWIIRNKVIWAKTNPMPASVKDRLACTWEVVYFATRQSRYYFDLDAIRAPHQSGRGKGSERSGAAWSVPIEWRAGLTGKNDGLDKLHAAGLPGHPLGKNPGDVWQLPTANYRGAHHAVFPARLIKRPLLATCPERVCIKCGQPWEREPHRQLGALAVAGNLAPICGCRAGHGPGLVLDPFMGAGTVAIAAKQTGRDWLGIEVNADFAAMAERRINDTRASPRAA
jgi:DNA modification methylase